MPSYSQTGSSDADFLPRYPLRHAQLAQVSGIHGNGGNDTGTPLFGEFLIGWTGGFRNSPLLHSMERATTYCDPA
jgi:hypothetical protein